MKLKEHAEQFARRRVEVAAGCQHNSTRIMKRPKTIWLILLAAAICAFHQPAPRHVSTAKIKVENDGGIINGINHPAATALAYDPYFIHVNDVPHIQLSDARTASD
ncbi:MAG: hypothetical protein P4N60_12930 [Verrucomicrobiae bacterium]|nr:hypothetical protein [Verrucomicrobiae bacterium]